MEKYQWGVMNLQGLSHQQLQLNMERIYTPLYIIDMLRFIFKAKKDITNITVTELLLLSASIGMISGLVGYMIVNYGM